MDPFTVGITHINDYQLKVLDECLLKGSGGMALPMGSGKTLISALAALQLADGNPILFVAAKSLVASWVNEFTKFFGKSLKYTILHPNNSNLSEFSLQESKIVLTTPDVLARAYRQFAISHKFTYYEHINAFTQVKNFRRPTHPYLNHEKGVGVLYSVQWGALVIDEAQSYTNILVSKGQSLAALCAKHRWLLSGTMFDEPTPVRILGYYLLIDHPDAPRNLPNMERLIKSPEYEGLKGTLVKRDRNDAFKPPKTIEKIVEHDMSAQESKIYSIMRETLKALNKRLQEYKQTHDIENIKRFSSYLLAVITYLRQGLVCPIIPISSVAIDISDTECKSELSEILSEEIRKADLHEWLSDVNSVKSTRIKKTLELLNNHSKERVIIFSCFASCLNVLKNFLPSDRKVYMMTGSMTVAKRGQVIEEFSKSNAGVLLLTFDLGANGLNLQAATTCILLDFWWNAGKTNQAVARIVRYGQLADQVHIYYLKSNTGLELALFQKHKAKLQITEELYEGQRKSEIPTLSVKEILTFIEGDTTANLMRQIYHI